MDRQVSPTTWDQAIQINDAAPRVMASLGLGVSQADHGLPAPSDPCPSPQCPQELWGGACPLPSSPEGQHPSGSGPQASSRVWREK